MKIDPKKLDALHTFLSKGGSPEEADIAKQLGVELPEGKAAVDAHVEALQAKWPAIYGSTAEEPEDDGLGGDEDPQPEPVPPTAPAATEYILLGENNVPSELELVKDGPKMIFRVKVPKDLVTLTLRGKPVEVDLIELKAIPEQEATLPAYGVSAATLILLAEAAKA